MLATLPEGVQFPTDLLATITHYTFDAMATDAADVFNFFNNPRSVRNNADMIATYSSQVPELASYSREDLVAVGNALAAYGEAAGGEGDEPGAPGEVPQRPGYVFHGSGQTGISAIHALVAEFRELPNKAFLYKPVIAAEMLTHLATAPELAKEFWPLVFTETHPDAEHESRVLAKWYGQQLAVAAKPSWTWTPSARRPRPSGGRSRRRQAAHRPPRLPTRNSHARMRLSHPGVFVSGGGYSEAPCEWQLSEPDTSGSSRPWALPTAATTYRRREGEGKLNRLRLAESPNAQPGIESLLRRNTAEGRLTFTHDLHAAVEASRVFFIAVGTPRTRTARPTSRRCSTSPRHRRGPAGHPASGEANHRRQEHRAGRHVRARPPRGPGRPRGHLPGGGPTSRCRTSPSPAIRNSSSRARCPTSAAGPGRDRDHRPRPSGADRSPAPFCERARQLVMDPSSAELAKYAANACWRRISFMNEIAKICDAPEPTSTRCGGVVGTDTRGSARASSSPASATGAVASPRTCRRWANGERAGSRRRMMAAIDQRQRPAEARLGDGCSAVLDPGGASKRLAMWGLAFKPQTDDMREAPAIPFVEQLLWQGVHVQAYDPEAMRTALAVFKSYLGAGAAASRASRAASPTRPSRAAGRSPSRPTLRCARPRRGAGHPHRVERVPLARLPPHALPDGALLHLRRPERLHQGRDGAGGLRVPLGGPPLTCVRYAPTG